MSNKSRYLTIKASTVDTDEFGVALPDIFSFPIDEYKQTQPSQKYCLSARDIYRFDLLMYQFYGDSNYDDLVLWLNSIGHIADVSPGTIIELPAKIDIDTFYKDYFV